MILASKTICEILQHTLKNKYILLFCSDPRVAKEMLLQEPDILILCLSLPGTDGLTFLRENAAILPPRIIALTRYYDDRILFELEELGVSQVARVPCIMDF